MCLLLDKHVHIRNPVPNHVPKSRSYKHLLTNLAEILVFDYSVTIVLCLCKPSVLPNISRGIFSGLISFLSPVQWLLHVHYKNDIATLFRV